MSVKKTKRIVIIAALLALLAISSISAYFTDGDTLTNVFTVGQVKIDLIEEAWDAKGADHIEGDITPRQEIAKDPKVINVGINDAFVFMEVVVPYAKVKTAGDDGTTVTADKTPLFSYDLNSGWVQMGGPTEDAVNKTYTYLYAYCTENAMTPLLKDGITPPLFDYIRFANVVEDQGLETTSKDVVISAYAIQTTNINDGKGDLDGDNADGKTAPAQVWAVINNQQYVALDYIESTGIQWINSGVTLTEYAYNGNLMFTEVPADKEIAAVFGAQEKESPWHEKSVTVQDGTWRLYSYGGGGLVSTGGTAVANTKYHISGQHQSGNILLNVDDDLTLTNTTFYDVNDNPIGIFAMYNPGSQGTVIAKHYAKMRLYNLSFSNLVDGTQVRNFVPCKLTSDIEASKCADPSLPHTKDTVGLWDTVENKFYTNKGTGAGFVAGNPR